MVGRISVTPRTDRRRSSRPPTISSILSIEVPSGAFKLMLNSLRSSCGMKSLPTKITAGTEESIMSTAAARDSLRCESTHLRPRV